MMTYELDAQLAMPEAALLDLKKRLAFAAPSDTVRGLFFRGVLDTVRSLAGDEPAQRCRGMLGKAPFFDFFHYSILDFLRLAFTAAQYISHREGDFDAALRQLGRKGMLDFLRSTAGRTFLTFSVNDPRRALTNLPVLFRTVASYGDRAVEWRGPQHCRVVMTRDFMPPAYHEGELLALMEYLHLGSVEVVSRETGALDSEYEIRWR
jgi:uncharacterized protein (TIGR02265 family)